MKRIRRHSPTRTALSTPLVGALVVTTALLLAGLPGVVQAQSSVPANSPAQPSSPPDTSQPVAEPIRHLETVVVTASGQEERLRELPVTIQTFSRQQIEQSAATSLTEFLAQQGVAFFSQWTPAQTSINLRGAASDGQGRDFRSQVVVLINGRRAGTANLSKLGLHDLDRIEIIRGPGSVIYGSQALGGVINLLTKDALRAPGVRLRVEAGSWGGLEALAQFGATRGRWDLFASGQGGRRGDYAAGRDAVERPQRNTAFRQGGGLLALGFTPNGWHRVSLTLRTDGKYDAGFRGSSWDWDNEEDRSNRSADLVYRGQTRAGRVSWEIQGFAFHDLDAFRWGSEVIRSGELPRPGFDHDDNTRRQTGRGLRGSVALALSPAHWLQVGTDTEWTKLRSTRTRVPVPGGATTQVPPFDNNADSRNLGLYVEDVVRMFDRRLVLRGGLRADRGQHALRATPNLPLLRERTETHGAITYRVGATALPAPGLSVRVQVGTGYRAPTATELAADFTAPLGGQIVGNPDLSPERAVSVETGLTVERARGWLDVAVFRNDLEDRIATVPVAPGANRSIYVNRSGSRIGGLEWQGRVDVADLGEDRRLWAASNGVVHFSMRDLDSVARGLNSDRIERMHAWQGTLSAGLSATRWNAHVLSTMYGPVWYNTEENLLVPWAEPYREFIHRKATFWLLSAHGRHRIGRDLWLSASATNLTNANVHPLFIATNARPTLADLRFSNGGSGNSLPGRGLVVGLEYRR